jgi:hypothetical protein
MAVFEQTLRAMQADTLAGTGDENRGGGIGHERLASRLEQNYNSDAGEKIAAFGSSYRGAFIRRS